MGGFEARVLHAEQLADGLDVAVASGTDHELTLALRDYVRHAIMQHSAAMGRPVPLDVASAVANNVALPLAQVVRR